MIYVVGMYNRHVYSRFLFVLLVLLFSLYIVMAYDHASECTRSEKEKIIRTFVKYVMTVILFELVRAKKFRKMCTHTHSHVRTPHGYLTFVPQPLHYLRIPRYNVDWRAGRGDQHWTGCRSTWSKRKNNNNK